MITIKKETIVSIPTLHVVKDEIQMDKNAPVIFFLHGLTSAKEHNLHVAYLLAEKGFRVLLPDAIHHGEREEGVNDEKRNLAFWEIVLTSIKELNEIKSALEDGHVISEPNIGVIGTSMGAITMYGALTQYDWIHTAASFMGTAYFESFANGLLAVVEKKGTTIEQKVKEEMFKQIKPFDLTSQLNKLNGRPLFIWHGKEDQVVPYPFSEKLYEELAVNYEDSPEKLQFVSEEETGHKVSRVAVLHSVEWFEKHLGKVPS